VIARMGVAGSDLLLGVKLEKLVDTRRDVAPIYDSECAILYLISCCSQYSSHQTYWRAEILLHVDDD
jgi:hypothetical protein